VPHVPESSSTKVVIVALAANAAVTLAKFGAALWTGSSAMLSEAVHSLVDTGNEALLLYGQRRATLPPDDAHPLGHGRELYFWSFIVALLIFAVGAGLSLYEGVTKVLRPEPITHPFVNYAVLGVAFVSDGYSWIVAFTSFRAAKGSLGWYKAVRRSKDPPTFIVLFEDTADLLGLSMAFAGILGSTTLDLPVLDGVASVGIGLLLAGIAAVLARESKGLLIGEHADPALAAAVIALARDEPGVAAVNGFFTVQLAPEQVIAVLSLDFEDALTAADVEARVAAIERRISAAHREILTLLIKPQSAADFSTTRQSAGARFLFRGAG
jgi:cation diffusion facilitator family transporter